MLAPFRATSRSIRSFFTGGDRTYSRRHKRQACLALGVLEVVNIEAEFDGVIIEISRSGCAFRPASMFIMDRLDAAVIVHAEHFEARGRIVSVSSSEYGIQFAADIDQAAVDRVISESTGPIARSILHHR